jgi:hypothetical protein
VAYDNALWVMGGWNGSSDLNDVWFSEDGTHWTQASGTAGWSARDSSGAVVYNGAMWVLGGGVNASSGGSNDVWFSSPGVSNATLGPYYLFQKQ